MRILLTGATGFIGTNLVKKLAHRYEFVLVVRESSDTSKLDSLVYKKIVYKDSNSLREDIIANNVQGVIHLASLYLKSHKSEDISNLIDSNVKFPTEILESCIGTSVKWFINTGTFWEHYNNEDYNPINLYAATKKSFEDIAKFYIETSDIKFVTLKLCDTYGPGDTRPKIMNLWYKAALDNKTMQMSEGNQLIDISYIDNVIDAYDLLIDHISSKDNNLEASYCVRSNDIVSLRELHQIFEKVSGLNVKVDWGYYPYRERENMVPWNKGTLVPGWKPKISITEGIRKVFKNN